MKDPLSKQIQDQVEIVLRATVRREYPAMTLAWSNLRYLLQEVDELNLRIALLTHETELLEKYEVPHAS